MGFPSGGDDGGIDNGSLGKIQGVAESFITGLFTEQGKQDTPVEKGSRKEKRGKIVGGEDETQKVWVRFQFWLFFT